MCNCIRKGNYKITYEENNEMILSMLPLQKATIFTLLKKLARHRSLQSLSRDENEIKMIKQKKKQVNWNWRRQMNSAMIDNDIQFSSVVVNCKFKDAQITL